MGCLHHNILQNVGATFAEFDHRSIYLNSIISGYILENSKFFFRDYCAGQSPAISEQF
jgi:hypothetical protein